DAATGLLRADLASTLAAEIYPGPGDPAHVAAPAISRDGKTLALAYNTKLQTVALPALVARATTGVAMGWAAPSADGTLVVVANMGMLSLRNAATGGGVGSPDGRIALGMMATHPDWSPDGQAIVVATGTGVSNTDLKGGSIVRVGYRGNGMWDPP